MCIRDSITSVNTWQSIEAHANTKKYKTLIVQNIKATIFWDRKGPLFAKFLFWRHTINAATEILKKLYWAIQNQRLLVRGMMTWGVYLLHDRTSICTLLMAHRNCFSPSGRMFWSLSAPIHSPDLVPSNFHLFPKLTEYLSQQQVNKV